MRTISNSEMAKDLRPVRMNEWPFTGIVYAGNEKDGYQTVSVTQDELNHPVCGAMIKAVTISAINKKELFTRINRPFEGFEV